MKIVMCIYAPDIVVKHPLKTKMTSEKGFNSSLSVSFDLTAVDIVAF